MGTPGPEQQKEPRYQVTYHTYLASGRRLSYTACSQFKIREMQPVSSAKFHHFPITSCSREKRYQPLHGFSVLQAMESWAGPGNEATVEWRYSEGWLVASIETFLVITMVTGFPSLIETHEGSRISLVI